MQSFELLGGKYQQGEQILPGVVETFRSYEVPTGRPVFIHRVEASNPAAQEIAGLVSAGLIRSPTVRKMLLDVYERDPYRFVVTEPARQCVPLRDWLEREAGEGPGEAPKQVVETPPTPLEVEAEAVPDPVLFARSAYAAEPEDVEEIDEEPEPPKPPAVRSLPPPPAPVPAQPALSTEAPSAEPPVELPPDAEGSEFARLFHEALSGKLERSRRAAREAAALGEEAPPPDVVESSRTLPIEQTPVLPPAAADEFPLFTQVAESQARGRSTLVISLVVLGVLVALLVMFVVVFVKR